jgi:hypothetical protein
VDDAELRASHQDRGRVAEVLRVPQDPAGPVVLRIVLSGTVSTGHLRARERRGLFRRGRRSP